jgi:hypothetical protein
MQCLRRQQIEAVRFLSNEAVLVVTSSPAALELFTLPVRNGDAILTPMTKVAALGLPSVDSGGRIVRVTFPDLLTWNPVTRNHLLHNGAIPAKPFIGKSPDDLIVVRMNIPSQRDYDHLSIFVHSSVLLRHISTSVSPHMIPWHTWGPTVTRCCDGFTSNVRGQRCIVSKARSLEVWDFNPHRIKHLGRGFMMETETACLSVETKESYAVSLGIQGGICSSLPYVKLKPKQWPNYHHNIILDDDSVFGQRVSTNRIHLFHSEF